MRHRGWILAWLWVGCQAEPIPLASDPSQTDIETTGPSEVDAVGEGEDAAEGRDDLGQDDVALADLEADVAAPDGEVAEPDGGGRPCGVLGIAIEEGDQVLPETTLHLAPSLEGSEAVAWEWSLEQPDGSMSIFMPSAFVANPQLVVNHVGLYRLRLTAYDAQGAVCASPTRLVQVIVPEGLHVELTWMTPGDPDETDTGGGAGFSAGSDLDLHLRHPSAPGYFDAPFDCFWQNPNPDWGLSGPADDPTLLRDDTDGGGPEVVTLGMPDPPLTYRVASHYFDDWGYGEAFATVRVYLDGVLRDVWDGVRLVKGDLWESHEVGPDGQVKRLYGQGVEPRITPGVPGVGGLRSF